MARITAVPGITAEIISHGSDKPLTEYPDETAPEDISRHLRHITTTNFVETPEPGTPFSFKLRVEPPYKHSSPMLAFYFTLNGADDGPSQLCGKDHLDENQTWECIVPGWEVTDDDGTHLRRFRFTELVVNEDFSGPRIPAEEAAMMKVGTIDVMVYRQKEIRVIKPKKCKLRESIKEIPQKLIKGRAISRSIDLGEKEKLDEETVYHSASLVDGEDHPIAIFRFKYGSRKDLQAELIIPRSPSPGPPAPPSFEELPEDEVNDLAMTAYMRAENSKKIEARVKGIAYVARKFDDLTAEERKKLAENEWVLMNGGPIVKIEGLNAKQTSAPRSGEVLKRKRPLNVSRRSDGVMIIDLLDDSDEDLSHTDNGQEEDEVVFLSERQVKRPKGAPEPRVKAEN